MITAAAGMLYGGGVLAFLPGGGFGGGDVQLAPLIGLLLGWFSVGHVVVGTMAAIPVDIQPIYPTRI